MALLTIQSTPLSSISVTTTNLTTNYDRASVGENSTSTAPLGNVLTNDVSLSTLVDYRVFSYSSVSTSNKSNAGEALKGKYGTLLIKADGSYSYVPDNSIAEVAKLIPGKSLTEEFIYVSGSSGQNAVTGNSRLFITINGENDAPVAVADQVKLNEGEMISGSVATNDKDEDHAASALTYSLKKIDGVEPNVPGLKFNTDGSFTFDANNSEYDKLAKGEIRDIKLTYIVSDGLDKAESTLTITIVGANDAPTGANLVTSIFEGEITSGTISAADGDNMDKITFSLSSGQDPVAGYELKPNGEFTFDASNAAYDSLAVGQTKLINILFDVKDLEGATITRAHDLIIYGTNDAPVAQAGTTKAVEGEIAEGQLVATDVDKDDKFTYSLVQGQAVNGLTVNSDGSFTFDANHPSYNALAEGQIIPIEFEFEVADLAGTSSRAKHTIQLTGSNDAPVATGRTTQVTEGKVVSDQLLASDPDSADKLSYSLADGQAPIAGLQIFEDGLFTFDAKNPAYAYLANGQKGVVTFNYKVSDPFGGVSTATQTIEITGSNSDPVALPGTTAAKEGKSVNGQVFATDADEGDVLTYSLADGQAPVAGLTLNPDGRFNFDADNPAYNALAEGERRSVNFNFKVTDQAGGSSIATHTIDLVGTNDAPVLISDVINAIEGNGLYTGTLRTNDSDPDNNAVLTYSNPSNVAGFTLNPDGSYVFDSNDAAYDLLSNSNIAGSIRSSTTLFSVIVSDGITGQFSEVRINVAGVNDAAVIGTPNNATVTEDVAVTNGMLTATGTISIIDPDRGEASFSTSVQSQNGNLGTLSLSADGSYTYSVSNTLAGVQALNSNQTKVDGFTIRSADCTSKVVNFTIVGKNELASTPTVVTDGADPNDNDGVALNITGTNGDDILYGDADPNTVNGGNGADKIFGGSGNDNLSGGNGSDTLFGGSGNDTIRGGNGNDNDLIYGGYGADILTGNGGNDTFAYLSVKDTGDSITDFNSTDMIDFTQLKNASGVLVKLNAYNPASTSLQAMSIYSVVVGSNTVVQVDTDGNVDTAELEITLTGTTTALVAGNFAV